MKGWNNCSTSENRRMLIDDSVIPIISTSTLDYLMVLKSRFLEYFAVPGTNEKARNLGCDHSGIFLKH